MVDDREICPEAAMAKTRAGVNAQRQRWNAIHDITRFLRAEKVKNGFSARIEEVYRDKRRPS